MVKGQSYSSMGGIRIFLPFHGEIKPSEFENEKQIQKLVEVGIGKMFPNLTFLASELPIDRDRYRLDTVAFDEKKRTFVVIEYKNKADRGVATQALAYLNLMSRFRADLKLAYKNKTGKDESFDWGSMYAIIVAPKFDPFLLAASEEFPKLEAYEIKLYENLLLTVRRVWGGHDGGGESLSESNDQKVALSDLKKKRTKDPPVAIEFPDNTKKHLKTWVDMWAAVAEWLITNGHLGRSDCPVKPPKAKTSCLLNTDPAHADGRPFSTSRKAGGIYIYTNQSPYQVRIHSIELVKIAGLEPSGFRVHFRPGALGGAR